MYSVDLYTEHYGSSSDVDATPFESLKEAEEFFENYDIASAWNTERQCSPVGTMKYTVFCAELWEVDEEDCERSDCLDRKEYSYTDYMRSES